MGGCLEDIWRLLKGFRKTLECVVKCWEAIKSVWGGCLEGVGRLTRWCGEVVESVWVGSLEGVGRLHGGCAEAA